MRSNWNVSVGVGVGVGVSTLIGWLAWKKYNTKYPLIPTQWEDVGEVSELVIYPLKSGRGIRVQEAQATQFGLTHQFIQDRCLLVVTEDEGRFITGRQAPKLPTITTVFKGMTVTLSAPNIKDLTLDLDEVVNAAQIKDSIVFSAAVKGLDCGDDVANWLTQVLNQDNMDTGKCYRLLYNANLNTERKARKPQFYQFKQYKDSDKVVYADTCAYMLATESSLHDLNTRLNTPVTLDWFRANIIVKGSKAFDEDDWAFVKIGDVVLRRIKPCDRCIFTTVDPVKGEKTADQEPITTLKKYRLFKEPAEVAKAWAAKPVFGSHMAIDKCASVNVGLKVQVARASTNYKWMY